MRVHIVARARADNRGERQNSAQTAITPTPSNQFGPAWSPDGSRLAFVRAVPGRVFSEQCDILTVTLDGTEEVNLTNSDFDERDPAWAPDSSKIAFSGVRFSHRHH